MVCGNCVNNSSVFTHLAGHFGTNFCVVLVTVVFGTLTNIVENCSAFSKLSVCTNFCSNHACGHCNFF